jgi:3-phosphoshikimate 1-carboxyvinyltransferase
MRVSVDGGQRLRRRNLGVPGDISAAAIWMVAAGSVSGSRIVIEGVGLNPTRAGIIDVVRGWGRRSPVEPDGGGTLQRASVSHRQPDRGIPGASGRP